MRLRELILGVELRALGVEHLEEVGHPALEPEARQISRPRARRGRVLDSFHPRPRRPKAHQPRLHLLQRLEHRLGVLRLRLAGARPALVHPRLDPAQIERRP